MVTYSLLERFGNKYPLFILIDSDDPTAGEYLRKFPGIVILIDKFEAATKLDDFDNFGKHAVLHARNACFDVAEKLGYEYFLQLDDDYTGFGFRYPEPIPRGTKYGDAKWLWAQTKLTFNETIAATLNLFVGTGASSIAYSQGGDWLSAKGPVFSMRKLMNSFFLSTKRRFKFVGRANEDVNTYVWLGSRGYLFLTLPHFQICQKTTQKNKGGTTDVYLSEGTYVKSFYSILCAPSCVSIRIMGSSNRRLHHKINWDHAVPMILDDSYVKGERIKAKALPPGKPRQPMTVEEINALVPMPENVSYNETKSLPATKPKRKEFNQDYWKDRGFCGTQKLTDSIEI